MLLTKLHKDTFSLRRCFATKLHLEKNTNQANGLAKYAINFMKGSQHINEEVYERVRLFHTDSVLCGISAIAVKTNAPNILRDEANSLYLASKGGNKSKCLGSKSWVASEKAIVANSSAVREWDSNGTVFGYNPQYPGHQAGEFGHNDYYPVAIAAAHNNSAISG